VARVTFKAPSEEVVLSLYCVEDSLEQRYCYQFGASGEDRKHALAFGPHCDFTVDKLHIGRKLILSISDGMAQQMGAAVGTEILVDEDEQLRRISRSSA
jgi:hypothetical protein